MIVIEDKYDLLYKFELNVINIIFKIGIIWEFLKIREICMNKVFDWFRFAFCVWFKYIFF